VNGGLARSGGTQNPTPNTKKLRSQPCPRTRTRCSARRRRRYHLPWRTFTKAEVLNRRFLTMSEGPTATPPPYSPAPNSGAILPASLADQPPKAPLLPMTISTPPALVNPSPRPRFLTRRSSLLPRPKATMARPISGARLAANSGPECDGEVPRMKESGFVATDEGFQELRAEMVSRVSRRMHQSID